MGKVVLTSCVDTVKDGASLNVQIFSGFMFKCSVVLFV